MIIKYNSWIGICQEDMVVQEPAYDRIIMLTMFLWFVPHIYATLSS